jgi:glycine betaine/proline transport system ATP-binding protein
MRVTSGPAEVGGRVEASTKVCDFASSLDAADRPFAVIEDGRVIGLVDRAAVMRVLVGVRSSEK